MESNRYDFEKVHLDLIQDKNPLSSFDTLFVKNLKSSFSVHNRARLRNRFNYNKRIRAKNYPNYIKRIEEAKRSSKAKDSNEADNHNHIHDDNHDDSSIIDYKDEDEDEDEFRNESDKEDYEDDNHNKFGIIEDKHPNWNNQKMSFNRFTSTPSPKVFSPVAKRSGFKENKPDDGLSQYIEIGKSNLFIHDNWTLIYSLYFVTILKADEVVELDLSFPEKSGHNLFTVRIDNLETSDGTEAIDILRVHFQHLVDLRDFPSLYSGELVGGGRALLVTQPSLLYPFRKSAEAFLSKELHSDVKIDTAIKVATNGVSNDPQRMKKYTLLKFPEGIYCSGNLGNEIPTKSTKVDVKLRRIPQRYEISSKSATETIDSTWCPGYINLRIITFDRKLMVEEDIEDDPFAKAFAGMRI